MFIVGTETSTDTSIPLPLHAAGDLIVLSVRGAGGSTPVTPMKADTVPQWSDLLGAGGGTGVRLKTSYTRAVHSEHTSGTWNNATHIIATVFRSGSGAQLLIGPSSSSTNTSGGVDYPALTRHTSSSLNQYVGYRAAALLSADSDLWTPPSGWTFAERAPQYPDLDPIVLVAHVDMDLAANPGQQEVTCSGTWVAHTIQLAEVDSLIDEIQAVLATLGPWQRRLMVYMLWREPRETFVHPGYVDNGRLVCKGMTYHHGRYREALVHLGRVAIFSPAELGRLLSVVLSVIPALPDEATALAIAKDPGRGSFPGRWEWPRDSGIYPFSWINDWGGTY